MCDLSVRGRAGSVPSTGPCRAWNARLTGPRWWPGAPGSAPAVSRRVSAPAASAPAPPSGSPATGPAYVSLAMYTYSQTIVGQSGDTSYDKIVRHWVSFTETKVLNCSLKLRSRLWSQQKIKWPVVCEFAPSPFHKSCSPWTLLLLCQDK